MSPEGFEPSIYSLEGCRPIQARLRAHVCKEQSIALFKRFCQKVLLLVTEKHHLYILRLIRNAHHPSKIGVVSKTQVM